MVQSVEGKIKPHFLRANTDSFGGFSFYQRTIKTRGKKAMSSSYPSPMSGSGRDVVAGSPLFLVPQVQPQVDPLHVPTPVRLYQAEA